MTTKEQEASSKSLEGTNGAEEVTLQGQIDDKDRAGVTKGKEGQSEPLFKDDRQISITEIEGKRMRQKKLVVDKSRLKAGKYEYQLKDASGQSYQNGKWFPEIEVKLA